MLVGIVCGRADPWLLAGLEAGDGSGAEPQRSGAASKLRNARAALKGEARVLYRSRRRRRSRALIDWYRRNRERSRRLFDLIDPDGLLHPADRAAQSHRVLRGPPAGLQRDRPPQARARPAGRRRAAGAAVRARHRSRQRRSGGAAQRRRHDLAVARRGAGVRRSAPTRRSSTRSAARRSICRAASIRPCGAARRIFTALEHEAMHQETLLYMWHRLPHEQKQRPPATCATSAAAAAAATRRSTIPAGARDARRRSRRRSPFGWDNEFDAHSRRRRRVRDRRHNVTNAEFLEFVEAGGYGRASSGRTTAGSGARRSGRASGFLGARRRSLALARDVREMPLPPAWPVYVSHEEAARSRAGAGGGCRPRPSTTAPRSATPTAAKSGCSRGASGRPTRRAATSISRRWEPVPVGSRPAGASAWGVHDLVGNGWEWTSTVFAPFPGFAPMPSYPEYSADFFDGQHYVMKGASPATARELVRRSFRNWFRPQLSVRLRRSSERG